MENPMTWTQPSIPAIENLQREVAFLQARLYESECRHRDKTFQIVESSHLKQLCKFDITAFAVSTPNGYPIYTVTNQAGRYVSYRISCCYEFSLRYFIDMDGGEPTFGCSFRRETGLQGYFEIKESRFTSRNVFLDFTRAGGSFCIKGSDTRKGELMLSFLISLWSDDQIEIRTKKLWISAGKKMWILNELGEKNSAILDRKISLCEIERELLFGYAALKLRFKPLGVQMRNPVVWLGEPFDYAWINLNQRERLFETVIQSSERILNEVWLGDIDNGSAYAKVRAKANLIKLKELIKKEAAFFLLVSKELCEYTEGWLPIKAGDQISINIQTNFTWYQVCEAIRANQDGFEAVVSSAIESSVNRYRCNEFTEDLTALTCVGRTLSWFLSMKGQKELSEHVEKICTNVVDDFATQWDSLDDEDDVERFAEALYAAVSNGDLSLYDRFAIPDSAKNSQIEAVYDEGRICISLGALNKVLESIPGVSGAMILRILEVAGLIQKNSNGTGKNTFFVKTTVYFTDGGSERVRILPLPRKMFFRPGRIDLTKLNGGRK